MNLVVMNRWGELIPAEKQVLTDHLWKTRQTQPFWKVVEEVIKVFKKSQPKKYDSYVIHLRDVKENQKETYVGGKRFRGVSRDRSGTHTQGAILAMQVDFPLWVMECLRKLYTVDELPLSGKEGRAFFREFGKRFPEFRILESR